MAKAILAQADCVPARTKLAHPTPPSLGDEAPPTEVPDAHRNNVSKFSNPLQTFLVRKCWVVQANLVAEGYTSLKGSSVPLGHYGGVQTFASGVAVLPSKPGFDAKSKFTAMRLRELFRANQSERLRYGNIHRRLAVHGSDLPGQVLRLLVPLQRCGRSPPLGLRPKGPQSAASLGTQVLTAFLIEKNDRTSAFPSFPYSPTTTQTSTFSSTARPKRCLRRPFLWNLCSF